MKLKEYAKKDAVLEYSIMKLEEYTEKARKNIDFEKNMSNASAEHYFISGYIWALRGSGSLTRDEANEMLQELFKLGKLGTDDENGIS